MSSHRRQDMQVLLAYLGDNYTTDRTAALVCLVDGSGISKAVQGDGDLCLRGAMSLLTDIIVSGGEDEEEARALAEVVREDLPEQVQRMLETRRKGREE